MTIRERYEGVELFYREHDAVEDINTLLRLIDEAKAIAYKYSDSPYGHDITLDAVTDWLNQVRELVG